MSICVGLEGRREILLVVWVVYAGLSLAVLIAVGCVVGVEGEGGRSRELIEVFRSIGPVLKVVQVL